MPVGQIKLGMHVEEADGQLGVISGWKVVPGVKTMYNLEVAQDHTFVVGAGMWVVHNCSLRYGPVTEKVAQSGTLTDLWHKGYDISDHFVDRFITDGRGRGLSTGDIESVLKNGSAYQSAGDTGITIMGKVRGNPISIVTRDGGELHSIFNRMLPTRDFSYVDNPFSP